MGPPGSKDGSGESQLVYDFHGNIRREPAVARATSAEDIEANKDVALPF